MELKNMYRDGANKAVKNYEQKKALWLSVR